jgi:hypothetical protein
MNQLGGLRARGVDCVVTCVYASRWFWNFWPVGPFERVSTPNDLDNSRTTSAAIEVIYIILVRRFNGSGIFLRTRVVSDPQTPLN